MSDYDVNNLKSLYQELSTEELLGLYRQGTLREDARIIAESELQNRGIDTSILDSSKGIMSEPSYSLVALMAVLLFVVSIAIIGFQIFIWLKSNEWMEIKLVDGISLLGIDVSWAYNPNDWKGLAIIFRWIFELSLALFTFVLAFLFVLLADKEN